MTTRNSDATILYCSKGLFHPTIRAKINLKSILTQLNHCKVVEKKSISFKALVDQYHPHLIVLYFHIKRISKENLSALINYVECGGTLLAIHSAAASFKQELDFKNLMGGKFSHHGAIQEYKIHPANNRQIGMQSSLPSCIIKDELYFHEFSNDIEIILETSTAEHTEPVAWTKLRGKGKIIYFAPGHRAAIFKKPEVIQIIKSLINFGLAND